MFSGGIERKEISGIKWVKKLKLLREIPVWLYEVFPLSHLFNSNYFYRSTNQDKQCQAACE